MITTWQSFTFGIRETEFDEGPGCEYCFVFKFEKPEFETLIWLEEDGMEKIRARLIKLLKGRSSVCRLIVPGGDLTATFRRNQETDKIDLVFKYEEGRALYDEPYRWSRSLKVNIEKIPLSAVLRAVKI